jgi:hypothetical protein
MDRLVFVAVPLVIGIALVLHSLLRRERLSAFWYLIGLSVGAGLIIGGIINFLRH